VIELFTYSNIQQSHSDRNVYYGNLECTVKNNSAVFGRYFHV